MNHETNTIIGLFPSPVYITKRDSNLDSTEEKEIEDIIEEGIYGHYSNQNSNSSSKNSYIFDTRLYKLKEFCKQHIETYVERIISPKKELDFYITQSWLNITKPGESHRVHSHPNSIISGVFYVSTEEDDKIYFYDPSNIKNRTEFEINEFNIWNSLSWFIPTEKNALLLFPSWLSHSVEENKKATTDRISLSFNTFVKGKIGQLHSELNL